jgi:exodeoxyribonuclease V gamma subunit
VERFAKTLRPFLAKPPLKRVEVHLKISDFILSGHLGNIFESGLILYRYTNVKIKDRLKTWIYHLALNSLDTLPYSRKSMFIGENETMVLPPLQESPGILADLIHKYWEGLSKPLPFYPESSWEYAAAVLVKNMADQEALTKARDAWEGSDFNRGESHDSSLSLCFGKENPLGADFKRIALEIFGPMIKSSC